MGDDQGVTVTAAVRSQIVHHSAVVRATCRSARTHSSPASRPINGTPHETMGAVLAEAGRTAQVIVFTCYPDRYRQVGGASICRIA